MNDQVITREKEKIRGFLLDLIVYLGAFIVAGIPFRQIGDPFLATAVFTATATLIIFIVSVFLSDVSVYDPYWSVAPPAMLLANIQKYRLTNVNAVLLLILVSIWSLRLTVNWYITYKGIGCEDWRYAQYRKRLSPIPFQLISFFGLHFVPTVVVYGGMVSALYAIREERFALLSLAGVVIMLAAVALEHVSDWTIHRFLREHGQEKRTCNVSVWSRSRHPNYLGEMLFWAGMYVYFVALCPQIWYKGLGFLSIIALFLLVSIPMMEKHNLERRPDYARYRERTPMLVPLPKRR
jgi:steroid 5-alpha reductase family enzyme